MRIRLSRILVLLAVAGCGTPEFRAERTLCEAEWLQKIPPVYEQRVVEHERWVRVPTGVTDCETTNRGRRCTVETELVEQSYATVERVDIHKPERDARIRVCAQTACVKKFGNPECKAPTASAATSSAPTP
jgi:hypothetical protein